METNRSSDSINTKMYSEKKDLWVRTFKINIFSKFRLQHSYGKLSSLLNLIIILEACYLLLSL